jgi:chemotaxis family two-component system response regulator Rcp1
MDANKEARGPMQILLVEDSPGDVRLTLEAFREADPSLQLHIANMAFLRREGAHADAPRPEIILLDLNMPKKDGREVLAEIKEDKSLKLIPTVILTTSEAEADVVKCFELQANSYLLKPVDLTTFEVLIKSTNDFWLSKSRLPQRIGQEPSVPISL